MSLVVLIFSVPFGIIFYVVYKVILAPRWNPLQSLAGPPTRNLFTNHLQPILEPSLSARVHEQYVQKYGRSIRIQGVGPWDQRLLTLDPASLAHVLKNNTIYEKPWQARRLIERLIGCGLLAAEGQVHKRQRRVTTPAFSIQNMRALVPLVFCKGVELRDKWRDMIVQAADEKKSSQKLRIDVCHWMSRATFDVIGSAGFDYEFSAIQDETNELFCAYKEMFEVGLSQGGFVRTIMNVYFPWLSRVLPDEAVRTVDRCRGVISRVAGKLLQEKKRKILEGKKAGSTYAGRDLLSLLLKSNLATDLPPEDRISDEDILNNINTFMFAGSDTSSLSLTWTLLILAERPEIQSRLRAELLTVASTGAGDLSNLTEEDIESLYNAISNLPFLHNVVRESLRLVPPIHSSIRVATQDDQLPTRYPIYKRDGTIDESQRSVTVPKGSFVHIAVEGFNLDREIWGRDAWSFTPDRWDNLPEAAVQLSWFFSNILTFSAGPRSCVGMRFSLIEIKTFLYILLTNFVFELTGEKIFRANVVLTRPYISGRFKEGSQCPILVSRYVETREHKNL